MVVPIERPTPTAAFWSATSAQQLSALATTPHGLSSATAARLLDRVGPNVLETQRALPNWRLLLRQFISPIELILIGATVLSGALGDWIDATIILVILLLSGVLGFIQEHNAGRAMRALLASVEVTAVVLRDGEPTRLPLREVVPGDIALVTAGDVIPGDCLILETTGLTVDESALTGETFPADKQPGVVAAEAPVPERTNSAFLGTHVSSGSGRLLVVRTGRATEFATIADRLSSRPPQTGFERGMTAFGFLLTRLMVILVVTIFVINLILQRPIVDSALFSLALAVGLTPQLLPAIVSIGVARGARMMARKRVIVRRLDAMEDLGSMTILCSDKTGTMTVGGVQLNSAVSLDGRASTRVRELASLNAGLQAGWKNPIDQAIMAAAPVPSAAALVHELPYDFLRKRGSVLVRERPDAEPIMVTKGALDQVLEICTTASTSEGIVSLGALRADVARQFAQLSAEGYRVLGVAVRTLPGSTMLRAEDESGMTLIGLLTFADPVKPDAAGTIRELAASGVSVRMVTGDNRLVAAHVAEAVGLDAGKMLTGDEIDALHETALSAAVLPVQVFSELNPVQKERVVSAFRAAGEVVGYLGDGINDSPPLRAADVGITVDTAVPVARQSAAIVLLDKDLKVTLEGLRQGRRTFANTMKYIFMTTSANFGNMLSVAVAALALPFLPLLAGQILLINLLTDLPATTIATDSVDRAQLRTPQRWNVRLIRNYMLAFGALSSVFDLATFAILRWGFDAEAPEFRSAWFLGSILTEVGVLFVLRTRGPFFRSRPSRWVVLTSLAVAVIAVAIPYSPLAAPLQLVAIPGELLGFIFLLALSYLIATELLKRVFWRLRSNDSSPARSRLVRPSGR